MAAVATLQDFQDELDTVESVEIGIYDFPDADNSSALMVQLARRRKKGRDPSVPLQVVLVGGHFSACTTWCRSKTLQVLKARLPSKHS